MLEDVLMMIIMFGIVIIGGAIALVVGAVLISEWPDDKDDGGEA